MSEMVVYKDPGQHTSSDQNPANMRLSCGTQGSSSSDDDDEAANLHGALQAGAKKFYRKLLEQQASGNIRIPSIDGDALPPDEKLNPMTSDYLIPSEDDFDDIVGAVSDFISGKPRDLKLRQVQAGIYNDHSQTGTLHLLKGSKVQAPCNTNSMALPRISHLIR